MEMRLISLSLPTKIKTNLSRLAFGLPETSWYDPHELHLPLCFLELQNSSYDIDILDLLKTMELSSPSLTIIGPKILLPKSKKGQIILLLKEQETLNNARLSLEYLLKDLPIKVKNPAENLSIPLGFIDKISPSKLADWMETQAFFPEIEFFPEHLLYVQPQTSPKHKFFSVIGKLPLISTS